tara:strand:+ start:204 stop:740 length:537 start_codon:yes stop_codon:yes gene_type:complete
MIRFFDILISLFGLVILSPLLFIFLIIGLFDTGSPIYIQKRIGKNLKIFNLIKFRTMKVGTKSKSTHLVNKSNITKMGNFFRKYKIDELPQLINVLVGHMSLVGPRPCLINQKKLISERKKRKIFNAKPGITGLAQLKGINMKKPLLLSKIDLKMIKKKINLINYFKYILLTILMILK